ARNDRVDFSSELASPLDTPVFILARNRNAPSQTTSLRAASPLHLEPASEPSREYFLDISLRDTLAGLRHGEFDLLNAQLASSLKLPAGARPNPESFKVIQTAGAEAGKVPPLNVKVLRQGRDSI